MTQDSPYNVHAPVFLRERWEGVKQGNFRLLIHASFKPHFAALRHASAIPGDWSDRHRVFTAAAILFRVARRNAAPELQCRAILRSDELCPRDPPIDRRTGARVYCARAPRDKAQPRGRGRSPSPSPAETTPAQSLVPARQRPREGCRARCRRHPITHRRIRRWARSLCRDMLSIYAVRDRRRASGGLATAQRVPVRDDRAHVPSEVYAHMSLANCGHAAQQ